MADGQNLVKDDIPGGDPAWGQILGLWGLVPCMNSSVNLSLLFSPTHQYFKLCSSFKYYIWVLSFYLIKFIYSDVIYQHLDAAAKRTPIVKRRLRFSWFELLPSNLPFDLLAESRGTRRRRDIFDGTQISQNLSPSQYVDGTTIFGHILMQIPFDMYTHNVIAALIWFSFDTYVLLRPETLSFTKVPVSLSMSWHSKEGWQSKFFAHVVLKGGGLTGGRWVRITKI